MWKKVFEFFSMIITPYMHPFQQQQAQTYTRNSQLKSHTGTNAIPEIA
jgi:hypothetical protein